MENIFLKNELNTADRAKALQVFQAHTPSKMLAANIIGTGAGVQLEGGVRRPRHRPKA